MVSDKDKKKRPDFIRKFWMKKSANSLNAMTMKGEKKISFYRNFFDAKRLYLLDATMTRENNHI